MKLFTVLAGLTSVATSSNAKKTAPSVPNAKMAMPTSSLILNGECTKMMPICAAEGYSFTAYSGGGILDSEEGNDYSCLSSTPSPSWFHLEIDTPGELNMYATADRDIDFKVWGPFASVAEAVSMCNGGLQNEIDCSFSGTSREYVQIPNAIAGKTYVLLITNYANSIQDVTLTVDSGDATTDCGAVDALSAAPSTSNAPTNAPTEVPTKQPTKVPTEAPTEAPTKAPTGSPTGTPTTSPTTSPTQAPTQGPTTTPTQAPTSPGPWSLTFDNSTTSFSSGASNEIELDFLVGAGRQVRVSVYETCDAEANEIEPGAIFSRTVTPVPEESNSTHSMKKIGYNFNKTAMIGSNLWNSTTDTLSFCQVTSLVTTGTNGAEWVIMEDRREIEIRFDLTANFIVNVTLEDETIESANETVSFDDQVKAYKCLGENTNTFVEDDTPLPPNTELAVCIESENESVNLAELTDMVIEQDTERVYVVDSDGGIVIPAITSVDDYPDGIMVITRVPLDKFNFETGENITISGKVELELTSGRRLRALNEDNAAAAELEEVGYTVTVNLLSEEDSMGEVQAPIGSSDGYTMSGKSLGALGLMITAVIGLVM